MAPDPAVAPSGPVVGLSVGLAGMDGGVPVRSSWYGADPVPDIHPAGADRREGPALSPTTAHQRPAARPAPVG